MNILHTAVWACLLLGVVAAAWDLCTRTVPNELTLGGIAVGFSIHIAAGFVESGWRGASGGLVQSILGVLLCSLVPVISFARGEMGGGDVKLFAAIGALCGPSLGFDVQACTFLVTLGVVLPWRLLRHGAIAATARNAGIVLRNAFVRESRRLPLGCVKLPPVVMAPTILIGFCLAALRRGILP